MHDSLTDLKIGIIGLGYVGLPLAVEFCKKFPVIGFDINQGRIAQLQAGHDSTLEVSDEELKQSPQLNFSYTVSDLKSCNVYIVTVPTPIDEHKQPDLTPLIKASEMLGKVVKKGDIIIYESTVYPGATEEACLPAVERVSGLVFNQDFFAGYSPERINPGDKERRVTNILKVTSGSTSEIAEKIDQLYKSIITAGTHKASSIKVAEASKVIENVQRDVNIALVNELHQIFEKLGINTKEVIEAAGTKWNFMKLQPGLVGGHCIGVDPYYLLHKSQISGYVPDLMRKAREINDFMPTYIAQDFLKKLIKQKINPVDCKIALLGFTFKENCPDIRNTKVLDLYKALIELGLNVQIVDPWANIKEVKAEYNLDIINSYNNEAINALLLAVGHSELIELSRSLKEDKFIYDFKGLLVGN
ncbi:MULTISPECIES: nucleotide sugar dehydrogenase [unclassified Pseudoalteromonas]|uniref:nucleotide sugar dehydrogenase n=1 Tax=unclassified Pseudoalteromonas TaxID=194690 RepID=UPI0009787D66|nr:MULTISPECIES: nucleotide sugar dehydrogenase [unclassified Pseudoalteromonas]UOB73955.1 nucleotide sugar dehydrogenase [Pseudoalteromonas sp. APM04]